MCSRCSTLIPYSMNISTNYTNYTILTIMVISLSNSGLKVSSTSLILFLGSKGSVSSKALINFFLWRCTKWGICQENTYTVVDGAAFILTKVNWSLMVLAPNFYVSITPIYFYRHSCITSLSGRKNLFEREFVFQWVPQIPKISNSTFFIFFIITIIFPVDLEFFLLTNHRLDTNGKNLKLPPP